MTQRVTYKDFNSKRKFGVEIEVNRKKNQLELFNIVSPVVNNNCQSTQWHYTCNNETWCVKPDSSCGDLGDKNKDGGGYEVVSPARSGAKHLVEIGDVAQALLDGGANVNRHCGLHCHVEIKDFTNDHAAVMMAYWCKIERLLAHAVPQHRVKTKHCKLLTQSKKRFPEVKKARDTKAMWKAVRLKKLGASAKRTTVTIVNFQRSKSRSDSWSYFHRPTVELRLPESDLTKHHVKNWTRLFVHFVESSKSMPFPKNINTCSIEEMFQIVGLSDPKCFTLLSAGLFETRAWLLGRLVRFATSQLIKNQAMSYWDNISVPDMPLSYKFSMPVSVKNV